MKFDNCQLEIDPNRGVLYVHSGQTGHTLVRICHLPMEIRTIPETPDFAIDVVADTAHTSVTLNRFHTTPTPSNPKILHEMLADKRTS